MNEKKIRDAMFHYKIKNKTSQLQINWTQFNNETFFPTKKNLYK
jgi:hypothetical protein